MRLPNFVKFESQPHSALRWVCLTLHLRAFAQSAVLTHSRHHPNVVTGTTIRRRKTFKELSSRLTFDLAHKATSTDQPFTLDGSGLGDPRFQAGLIGLLLTIRRQRIKVELNGERLPILGCSNSELIGVLFCHTRESQHRVSPVRH